MRQAYDCLIWILKISMTEQFGHHVNTFTWDDKKFPSYTEEKSESSHCQNVVTSKNHFKYLLLMGNYSRAKNNS